MKKFLKISLLGIIVVFSSNSCNDAIEIEQVGRLGAEQAFASVNDLESGVLGVYNEFDYTPAIQFNSVFTDMIQIGFDNGGQGINDGSYAAFVLNPESAVATAMWNNYYDALNAASRVIAAGESITPDAADATEVANYENTMGAAYALRAWAHFELLTYFSPDYTDDSAPGVILINFIPEVSQELPRNTTGEVFAQIEADLTQAESLLNVTANPTFVSLDFVKALRARMAAYRGNYAQADTYAADLLSTYSIADRTQYADMYIDEDNTEIIFKLERTIGDPYDGQGNTGSAFAGGWAGASYAFISASVDGSPYYEMSNGLFLELDPTDIRYDVLIHPSSDLAGGDLSANILSINKYPGTAYEGQPLLNDLKIFRASEMLFIRAEAAADAGNFAAAAAFIDQLRDARFGADQAAPVYASEAEAFAGILAERRIELAYEGFRWVDMKRLGARAGLPGIERHPTDCQTFSCSLPINDHRWTVPIPLVELDANPNIQQTDGY